MSRTLSLVDHLLKKGRRYFVLGRTQDARRMFRRLVRLKDLPPAVAAKCHALLAELHMRRGRWRPARRRLTAALRHDPRNPRYHYLLASAFAADPRCDRGRAAELYRRALEWAPADPRCLGEYGLLLLELGRRDEGLRHVSRAAELAPDSPRVLGLLADGLRLAHQADAARALLRAARFRNPRDPRFVQLWNDFQFRQLHQEQELARHRRRSRRGADGEAPTLLPFVRLHAGETPPRRKGKIIRRDAPAPLPAPHVPRPVRQLVEVCSIPLPPPGFAG
jgi:Tfp pilus assembly protein PilF